MTKRAKLALGIGAAIALAIGLTVWHLRGLNFGPGNPGNNAPAR